MRPGETNSARDELLKIGAVVEIVGLSRATVYRMVESAAFPRPVRLSPKRVAWLRTEVDAWLHTKIEERAP